MLSFLPQGFSRFEDIEHYVVTHSSPEGTLHAALAAETREKTNEPRMMVGHMEGLLLRTLVRFARASRVLEIGTFTGYSTLAIAQGLPEDGQIITCDIDTDTTAIAQKYWNQSEHAHKIKLEIGPALKTIDSLTGMFDMVFIDADKTSYMAYWDACLPKVRKGGLIVADNVLWSGRVLDPKDDNDRAIVAFNQHVTDDPRVEKILLPLRDGITLASKL